GGSHRYVPSGGAHHRWLALICPIRRRVPPVARTDMCHQAVLTIGDSHRYLPSAVVTTGGSHRFVPSGGVYHRWLAPICPIRRCSPSVTRTDISHRRSSQPVARTDLSHQAACTTGGSHRYVPSGGAHHRWLALICPIRRRVPPVARTDMSHQAVLTIGDSHRYLPSAVVTTGGSHRFVPSGGVYHRWLAPICPIRRCSPSVTRTDISHRRSSQPVARTDLSHQAACTTGGSHRYLPSAVLTIGDSH
ncbi:hypothetical protein AVEN_203385-1, partial [Araneus ventricosus]